MVDFIHNNKYRYGVDAICRILPIAASTYYRTLDLADNPEHRAKRDLHDEHHAEQIKRIWNDVVLNFPFKDAVLETGISKEDSEREERYNEIYINFPRY